MQGHLDCISLHVGYIEQSHAEAHEAEQEQDVETKGLLTLSSNLRHAETGKKLCHPMTRSSKRFRSCKDEC